MVAELDGTRVSAELRDWVACLVRPLTDHLAALGNPPGTPASRRRR